MDDLDRRNALLAARIMGEFGASIAVPAVLGAWIGKSLDAKYGSGSTWLILTLAVSFILTAAHLTRRAKAYGKEYEELNRKK